MPKPAMKLVLDSKLVAELDSWSRTIGRYLRWMEVLVEHPTIASVARPDAITFAERYHSPCVARKPRRSGAALGVVRVA
jgi:hypothetical protein